MSNAQKCKEILESKAKKICVIAGPGSGKTKDIIIPKTQQLIANGIEEKEILLLSFSRLSALDLKRRVKRIGSKLKALTVHAHCLKFLLTENDHNIRHRINSFLLDFEKEFIIADLKITFPSLNKKTIKQMFKDFCAGWTVTPHDEVFEKNDIQRRFKAAIINWLDEHKAVMVDEIIYFALDHAKKSPNSDFLKNSKYILIDEYQDLNKLEQEFVDFLHKDSKFFIAVGDPDQSIYSFKYAYPDGIRLFSQREEVEGHTLAYCGRCPRLILNAANQLLVQENPARTELPLFLPDKIDGELDMPQSFQNQDKEFEYVYNSIIQKLKNKVSPKEILVIFRNPTAVRP